MGELKSALFTGIDSSTAVTKTRDEQAVKRLDDCALGGNEAQTHIARGQTGEHVRRVQEAVSRIRTADTSLGIPAFSVNGSYDADFARAVAAYKSKRRIFNFRNEIDDIVGKKTITELDKEIKAKEAPAPAPVPVPATNFVCGPDVTQQVIDVWTTIQKDFARRTASQQIDVCNKILFPVKIPSGPISIPTSIEELKRLARQFASINDWDVLPLFQGQSAWLRTPPIFNLATNGPCATPSSKKPTAPAFDDAHEDPSTCSNTVQMGGKCWLNGTVNYGTLGVMVKLCSDAKSTNPILRTLLLVPGTGPIIDFAYSLDWAKLLIKSYKQFGAHPEDANLPIAWTEATFRGGVKATPSVGDSRYTKCKCSCGCKGDVVDWDYVWEPLKTRKTAKPAKVIKTSCS